MRKIKILDSVQVTFQDYPENDKKTSLVISVIGCDNNCKKCHSPELASIKTVNNENSKFKNTSVLNMTPFALLKYLIKMSVLYNRGWYRFTIQGGDPLTSIHNARNLNFFINFFNLITNTIRDIENKIGNKYINDILSELLMIYPRMNRYDLYNILKNLEFCIYTGKSFEYVIENFFKKLKPTTLIKYIKTEKYDYTQSQFSKKTNDEFILGSKNQKLYKVSHNNSNFEFTLISNNGVVNFKDLNNNKKVNVNNDKLSFFSFFLKLFNKRSN